MNLQIYRYPIQPNIQIYRYPMEPNIDQIPNLQIYIQISHAIYRYSTQNISGGNRTSCLFLSQTHKFHVSRPLNSFARLLTANARDGRDNLKLERNGADYFSGAVQLRHELFTLCGHWFALSRIVSEVICWWSAGHSCEPDDHLNVNQRRYHSCTAEQGQIKTRVGGSLKAESNSCDQ